MQKTKNESSVPQDILSRRAEARGKRIRNRRILGGGVLAVLAASGALAGYAPANRAVDRASGLDAALAADQSAMPQADPNVRLVSFTFKAEGDNSISSAVAKYAPTEDLFEAERAVASYLPEDQQESMRVYPEETLTFAVNEKTHKIVPKDEAPIGSSVEAAG